MSFTSDPALQVNQLPQSIDFPKDQDKFLEVLTNTYKRIADNVNGKEGGQFSFVEQFNSQQIFSKTPNIFRNVYRKCFDMVMQNGGPILNGATVSMPHNINGIVAPTHIYGSATNSDSPISYVPLPYVTTTGSDQIQIYATATNVVLINASTTLTQAYIYLEYVKQ